MEAAFWGFVGTIVGALASMITTILSTRNSSWLHKQAVEQERDEIKRAFQRETLIELQDVLHDLMRLITQGHLEEARAHQADKAWKEILLSEDVNNGQRLARRRLVILIERIANDELRDNLKSVNSELCNSLFATSRMEADRHLQIATSKVTNAMEHIGQVLRSQY
ncbi:hypothetical protein GYM54_17630 [Pseudomonas sp. MTM4]|uniref:hypothetical protein n=1 Tax=unclassified Pseudomonas TaxID=196821 RepID=UPI0018D225F4|nr:MULTISPECIES: hypothetical protein [unclassified Pseudomonas]MBC8651066.1 hypothetical protein [Pseudomonas sp. MT4]QXY93287.1 hypothetical protein GYM54_17630 [Pseudomonas sp. MTM4]